MKVKICIILEKPPPAKLELRLWNRNTGMVSIRELNKSEGEDMHNTRVASTSKARTKVME